MTTIDDDVDVAITRQTFDVVRNQLLDFQSRKTSKLPPDFWRRLFDIKRDYVIQNNQLGAKATWCLEIIGHIQDNFISAFLHISEKHFRKAWDLLGYCERAITSLDRHFVESEPEYGIEHVRVHVLQLQELYHLKWGVSLGLLREEVSCSVCRCRRKLRKNCGHEIGEIYDGDICHDIVTKAKILHISLVDKPAQKYSVIWPDCDTQFVLLRYLVAELISPWDAWTFHKEIRRRHHPAFDGAGREDPCPCGSGLKYRCCCIRKDTVPDFPHFRFTVGGTNPGQSSDLLIFHVRQS